MSCTIEPKWAAGVVTMKSGALEVNFEQLKELCMRFDRKEIMGVLSPKVVISITPDLTGKYYFCTTA